MVEKMFFNFIDRLKFLINNKKQYVTTNGKQIIVLEVNHGLKRTEFKIKDKIIIENKEKIYIKTNDNDFIAVFIHDDINAIDAIRYIILVIPLDDQKIN